jgi:hypothetical protein
MPDAWELDFEDTFDGDELDERRWLACYLPQWSSRRRSAARYRVGDGQLTLRIDDDQEPWCPELDGGLRVSSLQTGVFAGPLGSAIGQHRFGDAVVREEQEPARLYTPCFGRLEVRMRASIDRHGMVAFWPIGYEDVPGQGGEICVAEIFGSDVHEGHVDLGMGVRRLSDTGLVDDFSREAVPIDIREFHVYAADWTAGRIEFSVDGTVYKTVRQTIAYPVQLMLGIYGFAVEDEGDRATDRYPKELVVDYVRGWRPASSTRERTPSLP